MDLSDAHALDVLRRAHDETQGWKMMIGGEWIESRSGKRMASVNPAYDEVIAQVPAGNAQDVEVAVQAGKAAFPVWSRLHVDERAAHCRRFAHALRSAARDFGMLDAIDSGNPFLAMVDDANKGASLHDFFAGLGMEMKGQTIPTPGGGLNYTRPQPYGVVGRIIPFNHPISFAAGKIAPADLQGGCFSISSLGGIGGTYFTPIINAPEVAILGVGKAGMKPVWNGKEFVPRLMLPLSLSYDHRVIDGALGARFSTFLAKVLSDIRRLVL